MICATLASQAQIDGLWVQISDDIVKCIEKTPTFATAGDLWTMCRSGAGFLIVAHDETTILGASVWRFDGANFECLILVGNGWDRWGLAMGNKAIETAKRGGAKFLIETGRVPLFKKIKHFFPKAKMTRCTVKVEI